MSDSDEYDDDAYLGEVSGEDARAQRLHDKLVKLGGPVSKAPSPPPPPPAFDSAPYAKMLKVGMPEGAIRQNMQSKGVSAADTDAFFSSLHNGMGETTWENPNGPVSKAPTTMRTGTRGNRRSPPAAAAGAAGASAG